MIEIYTGKPGSGKSLTIADKVVSIAARNERWYKKTGELRKIYTNMALADSFTQLYPKMFFRWDDPIDLIALEDVDIFWDEIATHLDSTRWADTPLELKRFLQQHRKAGIDIYGTSQAFAMVDVAMRRLVDTVYVCKKIMGSRNPSPTKPPIRFVWGLIWITGLDPATFEDVKPKKEGLPDFTVIRKSLVSVYDTKQRIVPGRYPPFRHYERDCINPDCEFHRVIHV